MTTNEKRIIEALSKCYMFRPTKSADFIDRLAAKEQPQDYELSDSQREWLYSLLHRYRSQVKALHFELCQDKECRHQMDGKVRAQVRVELVRVRQKIILKKMKKYFASIAL